MEYSEDKDGPITDDESLLVRVRDRYKVMYDADLENRVEAMEDLKFATVPGYQWQDNMKQERGARPCFEFNKVRVFGKRIINNMRANRPQAKVRAVEDSDAPAAEMREGLVRNIWNMSDADTICDYESEFQVYAGMGAWRVVTDYADDDVFDQDIAIEAIENPFCLYCDPAAKNFMKRDAEDWILTDWISKKDYKASYGDKELSSFEEAMQFDDEQDWQDDDFVRIAEYWWKEPHVKELWRLTDGTVVDSESDEAAGINEADIADRREVMTHKIMSCLASGAEILEGPTEYAGSIFPFVMVFGETLMVDGRKRWCGMTRYAKDAQRSYNVSRTAFTEIIAQSPKTHFWATPEQAAGNTDEWAEAHKKNHPFMLYNNDPKSPGPPARMQGPQVPVALVTEMEVASDELKSLTGIFDASFGAQSNETSGRAIMARQNQGEIATFNYQDNMSKAVQFTYEIVLDLLPHIYDAEREIRVLGTDGAEEYVRINEVVMGENGKPVRVNDMAAGKYDVTVTSGPNFSTLRQEAAETYGQIAQQFPELMGVAGDLVFKAMDLPYADDVAERLRTMLPPAVQAIINKPKEMPREVVQAMAQVDQAKAMVDEKAQLVQAAEAELQDEQAQTDKQKSDIQVQIAKLSEAKAKFETFVAKEMAKLERLKAEIVNNKANIAPDVAKYDEVMQSIESIQKVVESMGKMDDILANFMLRADQAIDEIEQKTDRKLVSGETRHEGGKIFIDATYDDGTTKTVAAERDGANLKIVEADAEP